MSNVTFLDQWRSVGPRVSNIMFMDQWRSIGPPVSKVTYLDQRRSVGLVFSWFWLVSMVFQGGFMVFGWFPWFFKVVSWFFMVSMVLVVENTTKLYPGPTIQSRPCRPWAGFGLVLEKLT